MKIRRFTAAGTWLRRLISASLPKSLDAVRPSYFRPQTSDFTLSLPLHLADPAIEKTALGVRPGKGEWVTVISAEPDSTFADLTEIMSTAARLCLR